MSARATKAVRCAIYTRVSTDAGLDQDFNSLDAQFEGSAAYIRSQAHAGWRQIRKRYDDGGFSGGSTERPALQELLTDVREGRVDIIVVYKVDRLTRSLADFAKLVELFDKHNVSFVSVTQQFNTTTSIGRLTLNVLLSFAQFEREVSAERTRDKIAASKRKGLWVGGVVPLGYRAKDRKITIIESEAKTVRFIFKRYLEFGSLNLLLADLRAKGINTKERKLSTGKTIGGIPFGRGTLGYLLRNRFYVGEVKYRDEILKGEQPAIVDRKLFDAVQAKLDKQRTNTIATRSKSNAMLQGRIFDDRGNRMMHTAKMKNGVKYRYYISSALIQGQADKTGHVQRVPAKLIEQLVIEAVRKRLLANNENNKILGWTNDATDDTIIASFVGRVDILPKRLKIEVGSSAITTTADTKRPKTAKVFSILWNKPPSKMAREIIQPAKGIQRHDIRLIRSETRAKLIEAIALGRRWLDQLVEGSVKSASDIARRERCSLRHLNRTLTLAFLSPRIVEAAVLGKLPRGIGVATIRELATEWSKQHITLGVLL